MSTTEIDTNLVALVADRLAQGFRLRQMVPPVRELIGGEDIDLAYAVQQELTRRREATGGVVVGRKIGLTSQAVQQQLGVDQPDFGVLFADMDITGAESIPRGRLLQPKAEAEIAFILKDDLAEGDLNAGQVRGAIDFAVAALEIVDSRIAEWDITITDTIADNASSGLFVLGHKQLSVDDFEPRDVPMQLYANDVQVSEGSGAACLGDPLNALAWLARTARQYGQPLRAGQIILSGALGPMVATPPGTHVRADIGVLGSVSANFPAKEHCG